jgi:hypothetical protein
MRGIFLALLCLFSCAAAAAAPAHSLPGVQLTLESASLRTIAGWLREHGREGWIGADVADAMGIPRVRNEPLLAALQRGFRNDEVLRIAQVFEDYILFMVQRPDDQVFFYLSTPLGGLQKAFVSIPSQNKVLPLERPEAELRFRHEVLYWTDRSGDR